MILQGLKHRTARLMGMTTVRETAVFRETEYLTEIARQLFGFYVEGAKALNTWGVYQPPSPDGNHLGEGGGVLPHLVRIRDVGSTKVHTRHKAIDQR